MHGRLEALPELIPSMQLLRPRLTYSQTAVDYNRLSSYPARLAAYKPERSVCDVDRKPGSAQRQYFCEPRFHDVWGALVQLCRDFPSYRGKDRGGNCADTNCVNSNPVLCKFQRHGLSQPTTPNFAAV